MGFPQGLAFRQTSGYVTNTSPDTWGNLNNGGSTSYPTTSPQGITYGCEGGSFVPFITSDRNSSVDVRLAGSASNGPGADSRMRLDLPTSGAKSIRFAAGDASFGNSAAWDLYDTTTLLAHITTATSPGAGQFVDANNNTYSTANWPGSNTPKTFTFSTTILRIQANSNAGYTSMAYFYIDDAGGATTHTASGAMAAGSATISGAASRVGNHSSSGTLVAGSAVIAGTANRFAAHTSSGTLVAGAAAIAGTASRTHVHTAVAALIADVAQISGSASRSAPVGGSHTASGSLVAGAAVIAGAASRVGNHSAVGVLVADAAQIAGVAAHRLLHQASGALVSGAAVVAGTAARTAAPVSHTSSGALVAGAATIYGEAQNGTAAPTRLGGFEMVGETPKPRRAREVHRKPLLERVLEARLPEPSKPETKPARKRAKAIEVKAAKAVLEGATQARFDTLLTQWVAQKPVLAPSADNAAEAFMAQVRQVVLRMQEEDDEAVLALLLD